MLDGGWRRRKNNTSSEEIWRPCKKPGWPENPWLRVFSNSFDVRGDLPPACNAMPLVVEMDVVTVILRVSAHGLVQIIHGKFPPPA